MSEWKANSCDCCNLLPVWLASCICPCIIQGITIWELKQQGGCGECLMGAFCLCVGFALNRNKLRKFYNIKGNCVADCMCYFCCFYSCLSTQEYLHTIAASKAEIE